MGWEWNSETANEYSSSDMPVLLYNNNEAVVQNLHLRPGSNKNVSDHKLSCSTEQDDAEANTAISAVIL